MPEVFWQGERVMGGSPQECCQGGNALAGVVIQHRGAIIAASATPSLLELLP